MYIHERENWWQFRYDANVVMNALGPTRAAQGSLIGQLSVLGFNLQARTTLNNLSLDVIKSSEIEGEILNPEQVRSSIARRLGIDTPGLPEPSRYIDGVVSMMLDATMNCDAALTTDRLMGWHNVLFPSGMSGLYKIDVARYRSNRMQVVSGAMGREHIHYEAPAPERVAEEMNRLIEYVNGADGVDPVIKSAIVHLWFVTIHPFDDGNGRIARALADMLLARSDGSKYRFYSMSNAICANRKRYYEVLETTQKGDGDITRWLLWYINCLNESLDNSKAVLASAIRKNRFWDSHSEIDINERQRKIINLLFDGFDGLLTTGRWSRICHCSRDTALNDANDLVTKGILRRGEGGGRSAHFILNDTDF